MRPPATEFNSWKYLSPASFLVKTSPMFGRLLGPEIRAMIQERNFTGLKEIFREWPPADMAELITDLPPEEQVILFRILPHDLASATFEHLGRHDQKGLLKTMAKEEVAKIINEMSPDDRTGLLEELPGSAVKELLRLLSPKELAVAQTLLGYPEKSVGRLMTPDFIAVKDTWTVQQVLDFIRERGKDSETINVIYVVDDKGRLIDDLRIREILLRPTSARVGEIRTHSFVTLKATDSENDAINVFRKYSRTVLPVVDSEGKLIGIVTVDDILVLAEKEATEDIQKIGGVEALKEPYMEVSVFRMAQKRAPWLVILFLSEMLTTTAMTFFEGEIAKAVVLALFLPLIISSGGNSGSQATTLIIRAMAIGEVALSDWWKVMRREIFSGLLLGTTLGIIGFLRIALWSTFSNIYGPHWALIGLTIGISLVGVVLWGTLSGSMLPFVLRRFGFDPATSSAPFVATLVDVTGLIIYFTVAFFVLRGTLL
jgi:magnesium transporter